MLRYMLDMDISSYIMKRSHSIILRRLQTMPIEDVCISALTHSELMYGVEVSPKRQKDQEALEAYLRHIQVLPYSGDAAAHYAQIRAALKTSGNLIGGNDLLIAAHARSLQLTLVTNNTREFCRVEGRALENWTEP